MTAETDLLQLPEWAACDETVADMSTTDVREAMNAYARACVSSATEALRAKWLRAEERLAACDSDLHAMQRRAERLAESLRDARSYIDVALYPLIIAAIDAALEQEAGRG